MAIEKTEMPDLAEDKEPIYFAPKRVSLVSDTANILSWAILVGFVGDIVAQEISLQAQLTSQGLGLSTLLHEPSFFAYIFSNMLIPLLTGLGLFAILQAASVGLNMLLETDYDMREARNEKKG
ncbi:MAG TPA: hypothetical protein VF355_05090 [Anaerolineaceae bacterium]